MCIIDIPIDFRMHNIRMSDAVFSTLSSLVNGIETYENMVTYGLRENYKMGKLVEYHQMAIERFSIFDVMKDMLDRTPYTQEMLDRWKLIDEKFKELETLIKSNSAIIKERVDSIGKIEWLVK